MRENRFGVAARIPPVSKEERPREIFFEILISAGYYMVIIFKIL